VGLAQLVRFLVVELTHPGSNPRFDMCDAFTANYSFGERRRPYQQRDALSDRLHNSQDQADFMNLKIKPAQSFRCAHTGRVCICVFIGVSARTCMSICVCTVFHKK
jgi:hypothetical protein